MTDEPCSARKPNGQECCYRAGHTIPHRFVWPDGHPNGEICCHCGFLSTEHDPVDGRCPEDEGEARFNREEVEP